MDKKKPIIVGFVADLMFTSKIQLVADQTNFRMEWIESAGTVGEFDPSTPSENLGEKLLGQQGQLFQKIVALQPALLLFDLTNQNIPWRQWIPILKVSPATRRIPIIAFGPHQDVGLMQVAKEAGAGQVLARSRFFADMPDLFAKHARVPDHDALLETCSEPLSDLAKEGIVLFNQGEFYKCHDSLEEAWKLDKSQGRELYRGILQTGIALYQIKRGNYRGGVKMLMRLQQWLEPLPPVCRTVDVAGLRQNIQDIYDAVLQLDETSLDQFDWNLVQQIKVYDA